MTGKFCHYKYSAEQKWLHIYILLGDFMIYMASKCMHDQPNQFRSYLNSTLTRKLEWSPAIFYCSLIPRPFPSPVFDQLQYAKAVGEDLADSVMIMTSGRHECRRDRRVVSNHNQQTMPWSASNLPNNELYWHRLLNIIVWSSWTRYYKKDFVGHCPPHIYPHVYLTSYTWLFLLHHFWILQAIKNWRWEWSGNEAEQRWYS